MERKRYVADFSQESLANLRRRRYGTIEVADGGKWRITFRRFPILISIPEALWIGGWRHRHQKGDCVRLYYDQPWRFPQFLTAKYAVSARQTSLASIDRAMAILDEIAHIKGCDALLCEATNRRITPEIVKRWGWEPHCPTSWRKHFIKRFYGRYPPCPAWLAAIETNRRSDATDRALRPSAQGKPPSPRA
jgi:hypothetical protein